MCASCGCLRGYDDHGEAGHITLADIQRAARTAGITVDEVVANIRDTYEVATGIDLIAPLGQVDVGA